MEFKRKQTALRQKLSFRIIICVLSLLGSGLYLFFNDNTSMWGVIIGICGSALVWSLVELFDFFVQTFYQYESERNAFLGLLSNDFGRIKTIIRANKDEIPMHEIKGIVTELYDNLNSFIFGNNIYPISKEFERCSNYIERLFWKFDACCSGIYDDCEEKDEYYKKLYDSLVEVKKEKDATSKRFFDGMATAKTLSKMTDIELSFDTYKLPLNTVDYCVTGNLGESFQVPGNLRTTFTFVPDIAFNDVFRNNSTKACRTVLCLVFRKVKIT